MREPRLPTAFDLAPEAVAPATPGAQKGIQDVRFSLRIGGILAMVLAGLATLLVIGLDAGPIALATGVVLAVLPVPFYLSMALWIDRYEPEPRAMVVTAFLYGATIAVFIALVINTVGELVVGSALGGSAAELYGGSISAPIVEESAKGFVIWRFYRRWRGEIDGPVDGVVYATMVGLGFAMSENVLYYSKGALEAGIVGAVGTFVVRGLLSPFAHPLFTSMTGLGIGIASQSKNRTVQRIAPLLGLGAAMALHSTWNTAAGGGQFFGVYLLIFVPVFLGVILILYFGRRREARIIRRQLEPEVARGVLSPGEIALLSSSKARRRAGQRVRLLRGRKGRRAVREYCRAASDLAFHRQRVARGLAPGGAVAAQSEARLIAQLHAAREPIADLVVS